MCTSYFLSVSNDFPGYFDVTKGLPQELQQSYTAYPGSAMPVITRNSPNMVEMMIWGLIPSWSKDPKIGKKLFNARAETVQTKPLFRTAFQHHCIVPSSSFFEWTGEDGMKIKKNFAPRKEPFLAIAGIYDVWKDAENIVVKTFSMITNEASAIVGKYHNRQPLMLRKDEMELWLDKDTSEKMITAVLLGQHTPTLSVV